VAGLGAWAAASDAGHRVSQHSIGGRTSAHVLEVLKKDKETRQHRFPTLALIVDRLILNLAFFSAEGLRLTVAVPKTPNGEERNCGYHWVALALAENEEG
jgi:hypothetical protein